GDAYHSLNEQKLNKAKQEAKFIQKVLSEVRELQKKHPGDLFVAPVIQEVGLQDRRTLVFNFKDYREEADELFEEMKKEMPRFPSIRFRWGDKDSFDNLLNSFAAFFYFKSGAHYLETPLEDKKLGEFIELGRLHDLLNNEVHQFTEAQKEAIQNRID